MTDEKLAREEAQRAANYEAIKSNVKADVGAEMMAEAAYERDDQAERVEHAAHELRRTAVDEVVQTHREIERGRVAARVSQVVDYIFFLIYGLLAIRLLLALFAARSTVGFTEFIRGVTDPLYEPFRGIVPSPSTPEGFTLALPIVIALAAYALLHLAINGVLRMLAQRKVEI